MAVKINTLPRRKIGILLSQYLSCLGSIAFKEFKVLVKSPTFFGVLSLMTGIWSYFFIRSLSEFIKIREGNIHITLFSSHFFLINLVFLIAIPALTMRLLSEEKKNATYDLLLTSPITATQIVVGKFFGAYGVALLILFVSLLYPLSTALIADLSWGPFFTSYLGLVLLTGVYVAIGIFSSSLTDAVFLSAIMGSVFNLMTWFIGQGSAQLKDTKIAHIMEQISLGDHFLSFLRGTIQMKSVVFFVSFIVLFLFLAQRVVESSRWR